MADSTSPDERTTAERVRAEATLMLEYADAADALVKAKSRKNYRDTDAYRKAAAKVDELRTYWRRIGEAVPEGHPGHRTPIAPIKRGVR